MRANNLTLLTDLYELTMMQGYFKNPTNQTVIFDMFYRTNPCGGAFAITAGLEQMIEYIENLKFTDEDIKYLRSLNIFEEDFLEYLSNFRFTGDIYAIPEGTVVFPREPLVKVVAPIMEAQLVETAILNIINHQSLIATKAARVCYAAKGDAIMEFGLRRAQGPDAGIFGARANLAKCLLYAINGGVDEKSHEQCGPNYAPITGEYLNYDEVLPKYVQMLDWLAGLYVNVLNLIQYMHDKYYYEEAEMALIDTDVRRTFATGIAGFSHVIDSLSAIKYAKVKVVRDETGLATGYEVEGDFPKYGNDDDRADEIGVWLLRTFLEMIKKRHTYRNSEATTSILTITSNVVYGKYTGALPDGRAAFTPFAPGANPSYGAEQNGLLASLNSVAKLPYHWALDGISNTQTINPEALGHSEEERKENLVQVMDGYFDQGAHHLNVNVFGKEKLLDAMEHPEKEEYANFTIRVSGYAVKFIDLTREQQMDVISRTCHAAL